MNPKEIGRFLKLLRNEKGITQEQLAEILGVSGRTVSRWETGNNLPDLSVLIQISEYYGVEIKEILNAERKSEKMEKELKETLLKVADYNELKKQKAVKAGNISFGIMFIACAVAIMVQVILTGNLSLVIGETVIMVAGGFVYLYFMVRSGAWNTVKNTPKKNFLVSIICTGVFSIEFYLLARKNEVETIQMIIGTICFFVVFTIVSYILLRLLSYLSEKNQ